MSSEHEKHPYYKIFGWLTILTIIEIAWALYVGNRFLLVSGLSVMAGTKAVMVALYYMHLKYEGRLIWVIVCVPIVLVIFMISGFLPDAIGYY